MQGLQLAVSGLFIQGALFDGRHLHPVAADSPTSTAMPTCYVAWATKTSPLPVEPHLEAPLYVDAGRTNLLADIQLPLQDPSVSAQWILAGVAAVVSP